MTTTYSTIRQKNHDDNNEGDDNNDKIMVTTMIMVIPIMLITTTMVIMDVYGLAKGSLSADLNRSQPRRIAVQPTLKGGGSGRRPDRPTEVP